MYTVTKLIIKKIKNKTAASEREPISNPSHDYGATTGAAATTKSSPAGGIVDFSPTKLYNLREGIADNVNIINNGLHSLEKMMNSIAGPSDNIQLNDKIQEVQQRVKISVLKTTHDVKQLGSLLRCGDEAQKLQVKHLIHAFKDALTRYTTVQLQVTGKMAPRIPPQESVENNDLRAIEQQALTDNEEAQLLNQEQAQAHRDHFETSMLPGNKGNIKKIEAGVLNINQIMMDLDKMVQQQGQTVDSEEAHIEVESDAVRAAEAMARAAWAADKRRLRKIRFIISIIIGTIVANILIIAFH